MMRDLNLMPQLAGRRYFAATAAIAALTMSAMPTTGVSAQNRSVPDTFTAKTTEMSPSGLELRIQILEWSDPDARAAVVDALAAGGDVRAALIPEPTVGYIWVSGSSVGYSVKYADRVTRPDGSEQLTFVTDRKLGAYAFRGWESPEAAAAADIDYSVIELDLDSQGLGDGTFSLAAGVALDPESGTVSLETAATTPRLLTDARAEPKPYWATAESQSY